MISSKVIAILAVSALGGVGAIPTTLADRSDSPVCRPSVHRHSSSICNALGRITDDQSMPFIHSGALSYQDCANSCASTLNQCQTFFWEAGTCATYSGILSRDNFVYSPDGGLFNDRNCFDCSTTDPVLALDFEDKNVDNWGIEDDVEDNYYFDVQTPKTAYKGTTSAFRVMEGGETGSARVYYIPEIPVEAGTYKLGFTAKNNFMTNPTSSTKWEFVTVTVSGADRDFYRGPPSGVSLGFSWYQFEMEFEVAEGQEGSAFLSFAMSASGFLLDYYFDDIYIMKA